MIFRNKNLKTLIVACSVLAGVWLTFALLAPSCAGLMSKAVENVGSKYPFWTLEVRYKGAVWGPDCETIYLLKQVTLLKRVNPMADIAVLGGGVRWEGSVLYFCSMKYDGTERKEIRQIDAVIPEAGMKMTLMPPDYKKILFGSAGLYLMDFDGKNVEKILERVGDEFLPSPDGKKIAFIREMPYPPGQKLLQNPVVLFVFDMETRQIEEINLFENGKYGVPRELRWHPDSLYLIGWDGVVASPFLVDIMLNKRIGLDIPHDGLKRGEDGQFRFDYPEWKNGNIWFAAQDQDVWFLFARDGKLVKRVIQKYENTGWDERGLINLGNTSLDRTKQFILHHDYDDQDGNHRDGAYWVKEKITGKVYETSICQVTEIPCKEEDFKQRTVW